MNRYMKLANAGVCHGVLLFSMGLTTEVWAKDIDESPMSDKPVSHNPWSRYEDWPDKNWNKFNDLTTQVSPPVGQVPDVSLPISGDPKKGMELAFDRSRGGSCVACHIMGINTPELPGNVGPDLSTIGAQRSDQELFNVVYEPRLINPATVMPPWGTNGVFNVDEIKDIVAFLKTLQTPAVFANSHDDPAKRELPVESRDNLDPVENPAMEAVDLGATLFTKKGPQGKACADCHASPEVSFREWAATMPQYSKKLQRVVGVEEFVSRHTLATTGDSFLMQSNENIGLAIYLRHLANGTPINVAADSAEARQAVARGEALSKRKLGQLNFACQDCHNVVANRWVRGQWLGSAKGQTPHFPTWRTSRSEIWDIRKRFQWCNVAIRANELPPDAAEYGDIELYLTQQSNGLPLNVPGIRH